MKNKAISFGTLRHLLDELGFVTQTYNNAYIASDHPPTGCRLFFPLYADDMDVAPAHLAASRRFLDEFGILPEREFEGRLSRSVTVK